MGQTAKDHAKNFLATARHTVDAAIAEGKVAEDKIEIARLEARVDALEYLVTRLAGDIDGLETKKPTGSSNS